MKRFTLELLYQIIGMIIMSSVAYYSSVHSFLTFSESLGVIIIVILLENRLKLK